MPQSSKIKKDKVAHEEVISNIIKRDGQKQKYEEAKIQEAILKAAASINSEQIIDLDKPKKLAAKVRKYILENKICTLEKTQDSTDYYTVSIEDIQDAVEKVLIENKHAKTAKAYILYRKKRSDIRDSSTALMKLMKELTFTESKDCELKRENANIDGNSTMGTMLKYGSEIAKDFNKKFLINPEHVAAYEAGYIHIHDMEFYALTINCLQIDVGKLLDTGFNTGHGALRSPSTINAAATLACIIIQSNQNEMFGGQSIPTLDFSLAPYVAKSYAKNLSLYLEASSISDAFILELKESVEKYRVENTHLINSDAKAYITSQIEELSKKYNENVDILKAFNFAYKKTEKDCYQSMEALIHNLCTLNSRAGSQVPFSSLNTGMDRSEEGRMVTRNLFLATEAGLGNGETPIFPISIFTMKKGVNRKGDYNYDLFQLACRCSAKRLFPNFNNLDSSFNLPYFDDTRPETICAVMGAAHNGLLALQNNVKQDLSDFVNNALEQNTILQEQDGTIWARVDGYRVFDTTKKAFVKVVKVMKKEYPIQDWYKVIVKAKHGKNEELLFTKDHPVTQAVVGIGENSLARTQVQDLKAGDFLIKTHTASCCKTTGFLDAFEEKKLTEILEVRPLNDSDAESANKTLTGYDIETESDRFDLGAIVSHNCRTRVLGNDHDPSKAITPGRGNLSFTTLNIPYLALQVKTENPNLAQDALFHEFLKQLKAYVDMVFVQLLDRYEVQAKRKARNFPFLMGQHVHLDSEKLHPDDEIREIIKHGTLSIGFIGLAETLVALFGKHHGEDSEINQKGEVIIKTIFDKCREKTKETGFNFSLIASPAEGCSGRLLKLTKARFGEIEGITDREYFTNSFHVPVYYPIRAWEKIQAEAIYHKYCLAGAISYIEVSEDLSNNLEAFETLVEAMADSNMGYFSINHPVDRDPVCGYVGIINDTCPRCGRRENEGIALETLQKVQSYSPDPKYARNYSQQIEQEQTVSNT